MQKIYNDGTDQELYFKGVKSDLSGEFTGTIDGGSLPGAIIQIKEYKQAFTEVLGSSVTWDALAGYWFVTIPDSYITQYGSMLVAVAGTGMKNVTIDAEVTSSGDGTTGSGAGHIITTYTFNPTNNTITITEEGYTDIKQEQILSIFNSTTGQWYYNSELRRYGAEPGKPWTKYYPLTSVAAGVITYTAPDTAATSEDILQILVNKA